jgi:hypothetical protein
MSKKGVDGTNDVLQQWIDFDTFQGRNPLRYTSAVTSKEGRGGMCLYPCIMMMAATAQATYSNPSLYATGFNLCKFHTHRDLYEREYCTAVRPNRPHGNMRPTIVLVCFGSSRSGDLLIAPILLIGARLVGKPAAPTVRPLIIQPPYIECMGHLLLSQPAIHLKVPSCLMVRHLRCSRSCCSCCSSSSSSSWLLLLLVSWPASQLSLGPHPVASVERIMRCGCPLDLSASFDGSLY